MFMVHCMHRFFDGHNAFKEEIKAKCPKQPKIVNM